MSGIGFDAISIDQTVDYSPLAIRYAAVQCIRVAGAVDAVAKGGASAKVSP
jgi:hypothetical protein